MMKVQLKDGTIKQYSQPMQVIEIATDLSEGLARVACAAEVDGQVVDLRTVVDRDAQVSILTFEDEAGKSAFRHTTSHILAQAVKRLYPQAKLAIGPAIENGFYYDFDVEEAFKDEDLKQIEAEMKQIIKQKLEIERFELPRAEALALMQERDEPYKLELINELPAEATISFYRQGDFVDLCAGPHLMNTKAIQSFKLLSTAGAYWRGDEKNKMLFRVYGTAFSKKAELKEYLHQLEEAKKRDHNKLGRELEIFTTSEMVGQGLPLIMPKGAKAIQILQRYVEDTEESRGYVFTKTPFMSKNDLFKVSGHWDHYKDGMFIMEGKEGESVYALRPMTCPFQYIIYKNKQRSYRDLPIRYSETSTLFRNESSGEMHGLIRLRQFTLADAHIFCMPEQVEKEFTDVVVLVQDMMKAIGIYDDVWYRFSKWDPNNTKKYIDNPQAWEKTQTMMKNILDNIQLKYQEAEGEAAFYGPKLDVQFKNVHGKEDTLFTIQIDFALAERFDMSYVDKDNTKKRPFIIHRSSIGCYERTLAMIIEKYAGAFPLWIAPTQVKLLPISDKNQAYAETVAKELRLAGIRVEVDNRTEKIGYKIREAQLEKLPYMVIVGAEEEENNTIAVRSREKGDEGSIDRQTFINRLVLENNSKYIYQQHMTGQDQD